MTDQERKLLKELYILHDAGSQGPLRDPNGLVEKLKREGYIHFYANPSRSDSSAQIRYFWPKAINPLTSKGRAALWR